MLHQGNRGDLQAVTYECAGKQHTHIHIQITHTHTKLIDANKRKPGKGNHIKIIKKKRRRKKDESSIMHHMSSR